MLLEFIFCTSFFLLPLIAMLAMIIKQGLKMEMEEGRKEEKRMLPLRRRVRAYPAPLSVFTNSKILEYQFIESNHRVEHSAKHFKERVRPRDGPYH